MRWNELKVTNLIRGSDPIDNEIEYSEGKYKSDTCNKVVVFNELNINIA
jgi:hypothetical protein